MEEWAGRAGFDGHHGDGGGIYVEDCNGSAGGNVCFAVNGGIDPLPGETDLFGLFDLVAHEFGHCLTLGHVGDGADGPWGPTADQRHHGLQHRPARADQVRLDPRTSRASRCR